MTTKHTPGPWETWTDDDGELMFIDADRCFVPIRNYANARLIAAAPEMLAALKELTAMFDYDELCGDPECFDCKHSKRFMDLIAKAEGRTNAD